MTKHSIASRTVSTPAATSERRVSAPLWRRLLLSAEVVILYIAVRLLIVGGPGAFPAAGRARIGPGVPSELKVYPDRGYDGQYVYRLALDPFTTHATAHGITLDIPAYRQQRIMTALLGHVVAWLPGVSVGVALIVVNAVAVAIAIAAGVRLAEDLGRHPGWGWALALPACLPASLAADLTEPVAWAGVLLGLLAVRRSRWGWAAVAFTVAMLARETSALVVAGFAIESIFILGRSRFRQGRERLWLLVPIAVETAWQIRLWHVWGEFPALSGFRNTGATADGAGSEASRWPAVGVVKNFFLAGRPGKTIDAVQAVSNVCERFVLAALILTAAWALITRRARPGPAITIAWALAAGLAVSIKSWTTDIQFLRAAMEAWALSVFVLMMVRTRWSKAALIAGAVVTGWIALYFLPRT